MLRIINGSVHAVLDYAVAVTLIIVPLGANFLSASPIAHWLSITAGLALLIYSLLTDYSLSVSKIISLKGHLMLDFSAGVSFVIATFLFGFEGLAKPFYIVTGLAVISVVLMTKTTTASGREK